MQKNYNGMTGNERLYESGRFEEFDRAVEAKNETQIRAILKDLDFDQQSIDSIVSKKLGRSTEPLNSNKLRSSSAWFLISALVSLIIFIGIIVVLYDKKFIPLAGPVIAFAILPVILLVVRWWQIKRLSNLSESILVDLQKLKELLSKKSSTYPDHVPQENIDAESGEYRRSFDKGVSYIDSTVHLFDSGQFGAAEQSLYKLTAVSTELWSAEVDIKHLTEKLVQKNKALAKHLRRMNRTNKQH